MSLFLMTPRLPPLRGDLGLESDSLIAYMRMNPKRQLVLLSKYSSFI